MDEILVHITAPTTRRNDDIYRSLAEAYQDFDGDDREGMVGDQTSESFGTSIHFSHTSAKDGALQTQSHSKGSQSFVSKESYGSFPSFVPSRSPNDIVPSSGRVSIRSSDDSNIDSSRLAQLERIQRTWKQRSNAKGRSLGSSRSNSHLKDLSTQDATFIEDSQLAVQAIQSQLSDGVSVFSEGFTDDDFEDILHSTVKPRSPPLNQPSSPPEDAFKEVVTTVGIPETQSSVFASQIDEEALNDTTNEALPYPLDFSQLPLEVFPPAPEISTKAPGILPSQMTPYLRGKGDRHRELFRSMPTEVLRPLCSDERGCWVLETQSWSPQAQYHFWVKFSNLVQEGKLGWGLSLYRELKDSDGSKMSLGEVRVYCWGEVVQEIWGVLQCCALGELVGRGSKWLDAEGVVVIKVR